MPRVEDKHSNMQFLHIGAPAWQQELLLPARAWSDPGPGLQRARRTAALWSRTASCSRKQRLQAGSSEATVRPRLARDHCSWSDGLPACQCMITALNLRRAVRCSVGFAGRAGPDDYDRPGL